MTNIFLVEIATGRATFIATARLSSSPVYLPMDANRDYVVWTEDPCGFPHPPGRTRLYDRRAGTLTELSASLPNPRLTPGGLIASGEPIGAKELIDPMTMTYRLVLPENVIDAAWSPDYRYAAAWRHP